ncbi:MAG: DNA alkylation repair protein, partial [Bacillota bacterium]|nr:DNA alkylation repair protein [Bacillota bacterium]
SIESIFTLCEQLLNERSWSLSIIAYDWAYRVRKQYNESTFDTFEQWLKNYVTDWDDCDDFCTHAFGELISQRNELFDRVLTWVDHPGFWVRRAAAVVLIYPIKKNKYDNINPFQISDDLLLDEHYLVLKGYGWMLKILSQREPEMVFQYLLDKREVMPRISFRYALEKMNKEMKSRLMNE